MYTKLTHVIDEQMIKKGDIFRIQTSKKSGLFVISSTSALCISATSLVNLAESIIITADELATNSVHLVACLITESNATTKKEEKNHLANKIKDDELTKPITNEQKMKIFKIISMLDRDIFDKVIKMMGASDCSLSDIMKELSAYQFNKKLTHSAF